MNGSAPARSARLAGVLYLFCWLGGLFSEAYVRGTLVHANDAGATAAAILAHEGLWRAGGLVDVASAACDAVIALVLYAVLAPVDRGLARLAAAFRLVWSAIFAVVALAHFAPLLVLTDVASRPPGAEALALAALRLHGLGYTVGLVFFGLHCVLAGLLIGRSAMLPRVLGALLAVAGVGYLVDSTLALGWPAARAPLFPWLLLPAFFAEGALALWLTFRGLDTARWEAAARTR